MNQQVMPLDLAPAAAEIFLLAAACSVLLIDLFVTDARRWITYLLSILALAGTAAVSSLVAPEAREVAFFGHYVADPMGTVLKLFTYASVAVAFLYSREYLADETGARLAGNPLPLAGALKKLDDYAHAVPMQGANPATENMFIVSPLSGGGVAGLFSTHPPTEERIRRLRAMAGR